MENLHAYTALNAPYPEYISINRNGDRFSVTVRSPKREDGSEGATASITFDAFEMRALARDLLDALSP